MPDINNHSQKQGKGVRVSTQDKEEELQKKLTEVKRRNIEIRTAKKAAKNNISYMNLADFPISPEALRVIPEKDLEKYKLACFFLTESLAKLASTELETEDVVEYRKKLEEDNDIKTELSLVSPHSFEIIHKRYATLPKITKMEKGVSVDPEEFKKLQSKIKTFKDLNKEVQKTSSTELVTLVMASAVQSGTSDVHVEAEEKAIRIRFRVDGVLVEVAEVDKKYWKRIASRIKLLSGLKMNVTDRPQDGRFAIKLPDEKLDVRVSCMPTDYGESIVMRLLRSSATSLTFADLGFRDNVNEKLKKQIERPTGMIMTTGPTGSGKTTTLYAILNKLNDPETKIITLEDPIEYRLKGISQSQIDKSKEYTFAKGLRAILRQDPDIVMVGEIRDLETSEIALQAALTGHMVISTIHTNSASGALPRFLGMGVKPYILAPAINAIIGQRLARRVCKECKQETKIDSESLEKVKKILSELPENSGEKVDLNNLKFYKGKGENCEKCQGLGYKGRVGLYEVLIMNADIEKEVLSGELSEYKMDELATAQGMVSMVQDGILKAIDGLTTVEEIFRVIE